MKTRAIILSGLASLLLGVATAAAQAPAASPAPAPPGAPAQLIDAQGNIVRPGTILSPLPPTGRACLRMYSDNLSANGATIIDFDLLFLANVTGFPVIGGKISGNLCSSAQWTVIGGHLGPDLLITATRPEGDNCVVRLTVTGAFANPSSYVGKYRLKRPQILKDPTVPALQLVPDPGEHIDPEFPQHTVFVGYNRPTCP